MSKNASTPPHADSAVPVSPTRAFHLVPLDRKIGRASCRERVFCGV